MNKEVQIKIKECLANPDKEIYLSGYVGGSMILTRNYDDFTYYWVPSGSAIKEKIDTLCISVSSVERLAAHVTGCKERAQPSPVNSKMIKDYAEKARKLGDKVCRKTMRRGYWQRREVSLRVQDKQGYVSIDVDQYRYGVKDFKAAVEVAKAEETVVWIEGCLQWLSKIGARDDYDSDPLLVYWVVSYDPASGIWSTDASTEAC